MAESTQNSDIAGSWQGALSVSGQSVPLLFHINPDLTASMDSPAQGATNIPIESVTIEGQKISINVAVAQATFTGEFNKPNNTIEGHWKQGPNKLPLKLEKVIEAVKTVINRPQHPTPPFDYVVEEVTFKNHNIKLAGTLTLPSSEGTYPGVVLISGSGPQDRDQTFMGHKTFLVIADYLTQHGIAVLRFDDRGVGKSTGNFDTATSADFAQDVSAAIDYLSSHKNIAKDSIGLMGHSEGGLIAPITASSNPDVGFVVLLAGPGQTGNDISIWQVKSFLRANGLSLQAAKAGSEITGALNHTVMTNRDIDNLASELELSYDKKWQTFPDDIKAEIKAIGGGKLSSPRVQQLSTKWMKYFLLHNPQTYLRKLTIPVLAIHGSKDTQMDMAQNLDKIRDALQEQAHPLTQVKEIHGVNHLFQRAKSGLMSEYSQIEETMSPDVLELLANWVLKVGT
ncbi:S9 family peptidase [Colwellia sp. 1_MG-2023]|uniref:alpha/beta hydrolase family protein n=1 Tax=Colwellia sp. 1_MG-2023 TaxID=3062649 RepID=UPI0026E21212|nr:alpha/beta hydrolase [Colwellia sp. 1_MG-2023]